MHGTRNNGHEIFRVRPFKSILHKPGFDVPNSPSTEALLEPTTETPGPTTKTQSAIQKRLRALAQSGSKKKLRAILEKRKAEAMLAQKQRDGQRKDPDSPTQSSLPEQCPSTKKHFNLPTKDPLPLVIKIHDPTDSKEDNEYFQSLVPATVASPAGWDKSSPMKLSELHHKNRDTTMEDTIVIVRVRPNTINKYAIPEVVGVYPKTAEGFAEVEQRIKQPVADWKVYENGETNPFDPSIVAFGAEPDDSKIYVYSKPFKHF